MEHFTKLHYTLKFMRLKWFKEELFSFKCSLMWMSWPSMNYHIGDITCYCVLSWWVINSFFPSCAGFLGLRKVLPTLESFFFFPLTFPLASSNRFCYWNISIVFVMGQVKIGSRFEVHIRITLAPNSRS